MKDLGLDRFIKNATYELTENGIRIKVFGIPYTANLEQLDQAISFLMRLSERIKMIQKEKERLEKDSGATAGENPYLLYGDELLKAEKKAKEL